jgi:Tol biopolymer transport system component
VQVTKSPAPDTQPAWSPDGSTIVFRSERDGGGLYRVPALGGQEQQLTPFGAHPMWSKDGAAVFFLVGPSLDSGEGPARFYTVALDGSPPRELGSKFLADGTWRWIAPHPDGRISAVGTHATRGQGFFTFSEDGTGVIASSAPAKPSLIRANVFQRTRFQWNPAGTRLYVEATENALENLWRVQIDPLTLEWRNVERLTTDAASDVAAALSRDESRLAFTQRSVTERLWAFSLDASATRLVALTAGSPGAGKAITDPSGAPQAFSLSPDGNWLANTLVRPGTTAAELSLTSVDSGKTELLSVGGFASAWSADGRRLAFAKFQQGREAVFVRELGAPEEHQISPWSAERSLLPTCWAPDGRAVVVSVSSSAADNTPIWLWPASGGTDKPARVLLEQRGINFWQGQLSPNGRWLAFVPARTADPGRGRIAIAPAEGAPPDRWTYVAPEAPWADKPRWAPDGRTLYFIAKGPGGYFNLTAQRFDPDRGAPVGAPVTLSRFDSPGLFISPFVNRTEIGIAAHRAVLTMLSISGSVWMLDGVDR